MAPIIERTETSVGPRTTFRVKERGVLGKLGLFTSRLDPQGELNTSSPIFETAAEQLSVPVEELIERVKNLEVGESIEW